MNNKNNWQRIPLNPCGCGCGVLVAKKFSKGHGRRRPVKVRLVEKLRDTESGCIEWIGAKSGNGYGRIGIDGAKTAQAHRVAYELAVGPIPTGLHLDHLCSNPACCNPHHLEPVTQAENNARAGARRRATSDPGDQVVVMTVRDLVALLTGERP